MKQTKQTIIEHNCIKFDLILFSFRFLSSRLLFNHTSSNLFHRSEEFSHSWFTSGQFLSTAERSLRSPLVNFTSPLGERLLLMFGVFRVFDCCRSICLGTTLE